MFIRLLYLLLWYAFLHSSVCINLKIDIISARTKGFLAPSLALTVSIVPKTEIRSQCWTFCLVRLMPLHVYPERWELLLWAFALFSTMSRGLSASGACVVSVAEVPPRPRKVLVPIWRTLIWPATRRPPRI